MRNLLVTDKNKQFECKKMKYGRLLRGKAEVPITWRLNDDVE